MLLLLLTHLISVVHHQRSACRIAEPKVLYCESTADSHVKTYRPKASLQLVVTQRPPILTHASSASPASSQSSSGVKSSKTAPQPLFFSTEAGCVVSMPIVNTFAATAAEAPAGESSKATASSAATLHS